MIVVKFESFLDKLSIELCASKAAFICAALLLFGLFWQGLQADPDLFARMAMGKLIVDSGSVPQIDPFAYTPKLSRWIDHEWLSGWVFYWLYAHGGDALLFAFKVLMAWYSCLLVFRSARQAETSSAWIIFCLINCFAVWQSTVRAQVFTYLFFPLALFALLRFERQGEKRWLALFPLIFILWANAHGGFVTGLALLGLYSMLSLFRGKFFPTLISILCFTATFINPYGIAYWEYILNALSMPRTSITEWAPLNPFTLEALMLNLAVLILLLGFIRKRSVFNLFEILLLLGSAYLAYSHNRLQPLFFISAAVLGGNAFKEFLVYPHFLFGRYYTPAVRMLSLLTVCVALYCAVNLAQFLIQLRNFSLDYSFYPRAAFDWLEANQSGGNLLVDFNRGSYALWRLYPKFLISLDGRYEEVYPQSTVDIVSRAISGSRTDLEQVYPDYILLEQPGRSASDFGSAWHQIYQDEQFIILAH